MPLCQGCEQLLGASKSESPHADLRLIDKRPYKPMGPDPSRGYMERYSCNSCETVWMRDRDEKDADAGWMVVSKLP